MLALTRKPMESVVIGGVVKVKVMEIEGHSVKLAIEAPRELSVVREELIGRCQAPNLRTEGLRQT